MNGLGYQGDYSADTLKMMITDENLPAEQRMSAQSELIAMQEGGPAFEGQSMPLIGGVQREATQPIREDFSRYDGLGNISPEMAAYHAELGNQHNIGLQQGMQQGVMVGEEQAMSREAMKQQIINDYKNSVITDTARNLVINSGLGGESQLPMDPSLRPR